MKDFRCLENETICISSFFFSFIVPNRGYNGLSDLIHSYMKLSESVCVRHVRSNISFA